jgi:cell wall assembly regulator SMI1
MVIDMNNISWKRVKPLQNSIEEFEKEQGLTIPNMLKELIQLHNGGRPNPNIFSTQSGKEVEMKALLSYNKQDIENIYKVINYFKEQYNGKLLPFATEPSGDYFCLNLDTHSIVYWEHETNEISEIAKHGDGSYVSIGLRND